MKTFKILFLFLLVAGFFTSCYEDESSLNYKLINPIVIDLGNDDPQATEYSLFVFDTLEIKPVAYKEGVKDADLSFKWTISGNLIVPTLLDSNMTLKKMIDFQPMSNPYYLLYEVTDNTTGIKQEQVFHVTVQSPYGPGLIVSETKDDLTSDVSLIRGYNFSSGFKKDQDTVLHDLFSRVNKRKIQGVGTALLSNAYRTTRILTIGTDRSIDRVDPFDYKYLDGNGNSFIIDPKNYNVGSLNYNAQSGVEIITIGGKLYTHSFQGNVNTYSYYTMTTDLSDYNIGIFYKPEWAYGLGFDETNGRLLELAGSKLRPFKSNELAPDAPFDQNKLQGFTCMGMSEVASGKQLFIFLKEKDPATGKAKIGGKVYCYITYVGWTYMSDESRNGEPLKIVDLNGFEDIENASFFSAPYVTENYIFYATPKKIYTIDISAGISTVGYSVPDDSNEEISSMARWEGSNGKVDITNNVGTVVSTSARRNQLVVTTYDGQEGFIKTLPISPYTGRIETNPKLYGLFKGFGKITASIHQNK